jgi:hypothetical protein
MFSTQVSNTSWSQIGIRVLLGSLAAAILLSILDGVFRGILRDAIASQSVARWEMFATWVQDFRYVAENVILAAAVFTVGAKFIEARTILTVGFDRLDGGNIVFKGPDDDNVVWFGQRYRTRLEAEAVAEALAARLKGEPG